MSTFKTHLYSKCDSALSTCNIENPLFHDVTSSSSYPGANTIKEKYYSSENFLSFVVVNRAFTKFITLVHSKYKVLFDD